SNPKREARVRAAIDPASPTYHAAFAHALSSLAAGLQGLLYQHDASLKPLWALMRADYLARKGKPVRKRKKTLLRRVLARWLVPDPSVRQQLCDAATTRPSRLITAPRPQYLFDLGVGVKGGSAARLVESGGTGMA